MIITRNLFKLCVFPGTQAQVGEGRVTEAVVVL